jgi:hypothetical protein
MNEICQEFKSDDVSFVGLFPNRFSSEEAIDSFARKYQIEFPLKKEYFQSKTKSFAVTVTPEVVVYNETRQKLIYKGRIDNAFADLGRQRRVVTAHELRNVLIDLKNGEVKAYDHIPAVGCLISIVK